MSNLYIPICGFFVALLLIICFFAKKRVSNIETKLFSGMLITSFIDSILMVLIIYIAYVFPNSTNVLVFLNKLDYMQFLLWIWILFLYIYYVTYKDVKNINEKHDKLIRISGIFNVLIVIGIFVLPVELFNENNVMYSYGPSCMAMYTGCALYLLLCVIVMVINYKKIFNKKFIPFYVFIGFGIIVLILNNINPGLVIVTAVLAYINLVMYHTIENPDVKMLEEVSLAKDEAERANNAKSDFLSSMSHEIRTPLNAIVGLSEDIVSYKDSVPKEVVEDSEDILNASKTLLEIVGNILDINKIESNMMEINNLPYDFKSEMTSLIRIIGSKLENKSVDFSFSIAEDIPDVLIGDKVHVKEIINNLLSNAIKYTEKGKINVNIRCINKEGYCHLMISVHDTGRGIKAEHIDRLFNKFDRLDIEKNSTTEGTGLGLAITKALVDLMGGKINVQSQYGRGSIFMVQLRQKIGNKEDLIKRNNASDNVDYGKKSILIVDDNNLNRKVAIKALSDFDFEIDEVDSGKKVLEKVKEKKYDLILMDIMMPEMSGESTLRKLKEDDDFNIPVIALTADAVAGAKEKYISSGFTDYLAKPFKKEQIKEKLDMVFLHKANEDKWKDVPAIMLKGETIKKIDNFDEKLL